MLLLRRPESSLRQSLLLLTMVTGGVGMFLGYGAFFLYDAHVARVHKVADLRATAEMVGTNAAAALAFEDTKGGFQLLEILRARTDIRRAVLFRPNDTVLAVYVRSDLFGGDAVPEQRPSIRELEGGAACAVLILSSSSSADDAEQEKKICVAQNLQRPLRRAVLYQAILEALNVSWEARQDGAAVTKAPVSTPMRLLLVEDNPVNQKLAMRLLEKMGHQVSLANNGQEAVSMAEGKDFDLILMDIQMPVMGGVQATSLIRASANLNVRSLPIVAITAHAMAGDEQKYLEAGMNGYISKPIRSAVLRAELERFAKGGEPAGGGARAAAAAEHPTEESFSVSELLERVDNDRELLRDLLEIFKEDFPRRQEELREAVNYADLKRVASASHALKGMMANLAANRAAALAGRLEQIANGTQSGELAVSLAEFEHEAAALLPMLESCLAEVSR